MIKTSMGVGLTGTIWQAFLAAPAAALVGLAACDQSDPPPGPCGVVDDGNPCTIDACEPGTGATHTPTAAPIACSDGDACNGLETCDGAGTCAAGPPPVVDDTNPCTLDQCDPLEGVIHAPASPGTACENGDVCDGAEVCNASGHCQAGVPLVVNDDGNPCTIDACDAVLGVIHTPAAAGIACADANACDGDEACDGLGACALVTPPTIDDGDPCTLDACDPVTGIDREPCSAIDPTVSTTLGAATAFLYTGADPLQVGVAPGTIVPTRVAVLRGKVQAIDGAALPDVTITIPQHPELGSTVTHADGMFDMAVNGGGWLTVNYARDGYLPVHRQVKAPWQDYAVVPDVVLTPYDSAVTSIDLDAIVDFEVAQGNPVADDDGVRRATLLFPAGAEATMTLPDGGTLPLTTLSVRATEYTVGGRGIDAMPAPLPPTSAYTYAADFSVDEALAAGASSVTFSQPVIFYLENFLSFPVGGIVPAGFYDREQAAWVPSSNGRIVQVVAIQGNAADLDTDGNGLADDAGALAALGITDAEREKLAILYAPGQSLWRVPVSHFSAWDCNWPYGPPPDRCMPLSPECSEPDGGSGGAGAGAGGAGGAGNSGSAASGSGAAGPDENGSGPEGDQPSDDECEEQGSVIECQSQILGESVPITGTPFRLHYRSDRVPGRTAAFTLRIPISGPGLPASLKRIEMVTEVAGRTFEQSFDCPCALNASAEVTWDGKDAYGRTLQGKQPVKVRLGYVYDGVYMTPPELGNVFAMFSDVPLSNNPTRGEVTIGKDWQGVIGVFDARAQKLGGFTLDVLHSYDLVGKTLYLGDGSRRSAQDLGRVIRTVEALESVSPAALEVGADGTLYLMVLNAKQIYRLSPGGSPVLFAGSGFEGFSGDGGPATQATLSNFLGALALGPDESLYFIDGFRIRKVDRQGIITTVAGTVWGFGGDGGPATQAALKSPKGLAVAPDGSVYIADSWNSRIRKISPDGLIHTVAGTGAPGFSGDNGLATQATLNEPWDVALTPSGDLLVADKGNARVRRISASGIITTVAGSGLAGFSGDGGPATDAKTTPLALAAAPDGGFYLSDSNRYRIRHVSAAGRISTVAGDGTAGWNVPFLEGGPAAGAKVNQAYQLQVAPDGSVFVASSANGKIARIAPALTGLTGSELAVASEDAAELYVFTAEGRHSRTLDALTGAVRYEFAYDAQGYVTTVTDGYGNVTSILRDGSGNATAILGPFAQQTVLGMHADGYLATVTNPASESVGFTYTSPGSGLLATMTDAKMQVHAYEWDALGRLAKDEDPAGGFQTLTRTETPGGHTVTRTTAMGRTTGYQVSALPTGQRTRTNMFASAISAFEERGADGVRSMTLPDGMQITQLLSPDPRFGMQAPVVSRTSVTPSGKMLTLTRSRTPTLSNPNDPLSLTTLTETVSVNGKPFTSVFTKATGKSTDTSPLGRQTSTTLDARGQVVKREVSGVLPVDYFYDAQGRLTTTQQGTRIASRAYHPSGYLASITDALMQPPQSFVPDLMGRTLVETRPDGEEIVFGYDPNGNQTSVTPPDQPSHLLGFTPVDLLASYTPPALPTGSTPTSWSYNLDRQVDVITRPGGGTTTYGYDSAGRLHTTSFPGGLITRTYDPVTGKLQAITGPTGVTLTYSYDGSLLTDVVWSGSVAGDVHRDYDNDFRVVAEIINGGSAAAFGYDADSMLTQAGGLTLSRDPQNGRIIGTTLGSLSDTWSYSPYGEVSAYSASDGGSALLSIAYVRDDLGRIVTKTETIDAVTTTYGYTYDLAGRLTDVTRDAVPVAQYTYDANGNRLSHATPTTSVAGTYDAQDRLQSYGTASYAYADSGEIEAKVDSATGETTSYDYDALGNLREVVQPDGTVIEYLVDGENRRIGKNVSGALSKGWLYRDALQPVAELDSIGSVVAQFVYARGANVPEVMLRGGATYRIVTDHLGSPRMVVDSATGVIAQRMDYDELGNVVLDTNPGFQPFGFAGGLYDADTGLVRFGARDYDAQIGRWTAKDTSRFAGGDENLYAYAGNDPINYVDSTGKIAGDVLLFCTFNPELCGELWEHVKDIIEDDDGPRSCDPEECKKRCDAAYEADVEECKKLPKDQRPSCYNAAAQRYGKCLKDCDKQR